MERGFDSRIVSYEHIHSINPEDWSKLIEAIDPQPNEVILDAMCGYAAVGKSVLEKEKTVDLFLLDDSQIQIKRAKENLSELSEDQFVLSSLLNSGVQDDFFDKIVIKMGLHEVSKENQVLVLKEVFRILKPEGKLIIWDIMLDESTQLLFQDIIRKKDELAGFGSLTRERYFFREDEFIKNVNAANFSKIEEFHTVNYRFSSMKRLESELNNDVQKLKELNEFIGERFNEDLKKSLKYEDSKGDIQFNITKKVYIIKK